jgi:hypothetical protein
MTAPKPPSRALPNNQPYYVRQTQSWAIDQERMRHIEALLWVGEPALFVLLWRVEDYQGGYCVPCPRCRTQDGSIEARVDAVYQQPQTATCPYCFGTTYYGGIRAKLVRPAIFTDADEDERRSARGATHAQSLVVESTDDFRSRTGDFVFRRDGTRWQLATPARVQLRTGYRHPTQPGDSIGYARIPAALEDKASVAYQIPPNDSELAAWLAEPLYWPTPNGNEMVSGPLIPKDIN